MPRRSRLAPRDLDLIAPFRVIRTADLVAAGVPPSTIALRCRLRQWRRLLPGVVLLQPWPPSHEQRVRAALLYAGENAVVTGAEAARRHGLERVGPGDDVAVLVPEGRQVRSAGFVHVSRTERLPTPVPRAGVPLASVDRAVIDTARRLHGLDDLRALLAEAVQTRRTTVVRLRRELEDGCQRGTALPRAALLEIEDGIRSAAEGWAVDVHRRSGLPPVLWNPRIHLPSGRLLCTPDGWFDEVAMAWETDSVAYHPVEEDETARRHGAMTSAGIVVVHHRPRRLREDRVAVIEELWGAYRLAASRPRPDLRVVPVARGVVPPQK